MKIRQQIICAIRAYLARTGTSERAFSIAVCGDTRLLKRLEAGQAVTLTVLERVERLIDEARVAAPPHEVSSCLAIPHMSDSICYSESYGTDEVGYADAS